MFKSALFLDRAGGEMPEEPLVARLLVCGLGNRLKRDDGLGPCVIAALAQRDLPKGVSLEDFGTWGFRAALMIGDYDKVIVVDAIQAGSSPGQVYRIVLEDRSYKPKLFALSPHESDLEQILAMATSIGRGPQEIVIIGCEPQDLSWGLEMSAEVQAAMAKVIEQVLTEIAQSLA